MTNVSAATTVTARPRRRRWPLVLGVTAAALALAAGGGGAYLHARLRASLPQMEGERAVRGLGAPVRIERDALGVPVVRGGSRLDVARATGFLHAQERFFQMDLLRRSAAGELAALIGRPALEMDREARLLRLRLVARRAVRALRADERDLLAAYTGGANAGLGALGAPPFEYLALRAEPAPWRDEDSLLCALAMYRDLQGRQPWQESVLGLMRETLPPALADFLAPVGTEWDAPIEGGPIPMPAVPGPDVVDLRKAKPAAALAVRPSEPGVLALLGAPIGFEPRGSDDDAFARGSNNWAVSGAHTAHGGALLANDMHLGISVPNTWYRLSLVFPGVEGERRVTGVTLPGAPFVVAGSNGHVAWGFTNSEGDWADLVLLEPDPQNPDAYLTPEGPRQLERETETIEVKGEKARDARRRVHDLGAGDRHRPRWGAGGRSRGWRSGTAASTPRSSAWSRPATSTRRRRSPPRSGSRTRTSSSPTPPGTSAGRSSAASRAAWATTGGSPPRGRTGRGAGTAGSLPRTTLASWTRRAAASGRPTRASSAGRSSRRWAWAATTSGRGRGRSGTTCSPSTRRPRATCCACSSTTALSSSRAGRGSFSAS